MKRDAAEILKDALGLPTEARAALAGSLLESLDTEVAEDAEVCPDTRPSTTYSWPCADSALLTISPSWPPQHRGERELLPL